ncbi:alpha/beta-hydrolase lipase region [Geosmithia morbida]|uniref:Alpha/beta-hydrolase lipase region n=1 Tax=Geosmithia morbida TaxID=1094350 RepID=A0A9P4YTQ0_9HYPO|nr:alpha/beta-hydrolase lipase region [Geosmithia morbida]KAF4122931.1 alpha/beta-hydrolase lipase region [Geosmithia morbida]
MYAGTTMELREVHPTSIDSHRSHCALEEPMLPSHTNPLFAPLPHYGPPSTSRTLQSILFRISSFCLSLVFLGSIVICSLVTSIPRTCKRAFYWSTFRDVDKNRPLYDKEQRRAKIRASEEREWELLGQEGTSQEGESERFAEEFPPSEGGKDPIVCDIGYYARRVGLDAELFKVQTEDGFVIDLWHVYDPKEYNKLSDEERDYQDPTIWAKNGENIKRQRHNALDRKPKAPVLLIHGLLQSSGAFCCNDNDSLAFWLCKSGYDVWLGNNRCGFEPRHVSLDYGDPNMWRWNILHFGTLDLPALVSRVLYETGFAKTGLVCHSQGTTQTFVALAKEQCPDLGNKITVFCALAPAAYAGPLIRKVYFRFMRTLSPILFHVVFGIHAFIPFMMQMHALVPPRLYGWMGYTVLSFLFGWSDARWDRGLRNRMFQFSPVYVSAESMRWWLGCDGFAKHKCILATKDVVRAEDRIDEATNGGPLPNTVPTPELEQQLPGATAWFNEQAPPFALWVAGNDDLVDGRKLLRRFESDLEPHVRVCHSKIIEEYEHLDVIWAMDAKDKVFAEVRDVLWKMCDTRDECRVPIGFSNLEPMEANTDLIPNQHLNRLDANV